MSHNVRIDTDAETKTFDETAQDGRSGREMPAGIGTRLKHARLALGMRLREVAARAGCSESMISKIENERITPSIKTFHRVCTALDVTMGEIMSGSNSDSRKVWRKGERLATDFDSQRRGAGIRMERLIPTARGHLLQGNVHIIAPGGGTDGNLSHHGEEVGYVLAGKIELYIGDETFELSEGDSFLYSSHLPHGYRNRSSSEARVIFINTPPTY